MWSRLRSPTQWVRVHFLSCTPPRFFPHLMAISTFTFVLDKTTLAHGSSPLGDSRKRSHAPKDLFSAPHIWGSGKRQENVSLRSSCVCAGEDDLSLKSLFQGTLVEFVPNGERGQLSILYALVWSGRGVSGTEMFLLNISKTSFLILPPPPTLPSHYALISTNPSKMDQIVKKTIGRILKFKKMKLVTVI